MFSVQLSQPINLRNLKIVSNTFQSGACNNLSFIMKTMDHLTYNTVCEEEKAMMLQIQYTSWFFLTYHFIIVVLGIISILRIMLLNQRILMG